MTSASIPEPRRPDPLDALEAWVAQCALSAEDLPPVPDGAHDVVVTEDNRLRALALVAELDRVRELHLQRREALHRSWAYGKS